MSTSNFYRRYLEFCKIIGNLHNYNDYINYNLTMSYFIELGITNYDNPNTFENKLSQIAYKYFVPRGFNW